MRRTRLNPQNSVPRFLLLGQNRQNTLVFWCPAIPGPAAGHLVSWCSSLGHGSLVFSLFWCFGFLVYWCSGGLVFSLFLFSGGLVLWCSGFQLVLVLWCSGALVAWCILPKLPTGSLCCHTCLLLPQRQLYGGNRDCASDSGIIIPESDIYSSDGSKYLPTIAPDR